MKNESHGCRTTQKFIVIELIYLIIVEQLYIRAGNRMCHFLDFRNNFLKKQVFATDKRCALVRQECGNKKRP